MKIFVLFFSILFLTSCPNEDVLIDKVCEVENPLEELAWLKDIKTNFLLSSVYQKRIIEEYNYKNQTVFLIDNCSDCADNLVIAYDCNGNKVCEFGGIAGLNTCTDFEKNAVKIKVLWEN